MKKNIVMSGAALAAMIAVGAAATNLPVMQQASAAVASARVSTSAVASVATPSSGTATGTSGRGSTGHNGHGRVNGGGPGFGGRGFGGPTLTVTAVGSNTINATTRGGQAITVTVGVSTTYSEVGTSTTLAAVKSGEQIAVRGHLTNGTTINATQIDIILPQTVGVVTGVTGSTITVTDFDGATHTVTVNDQTAYSKAGTTAALSDVATGTAIVAAGTRATDGTLTAQRVAIQLPRVSGTVTAASGGTYTVAGRESTSYTIDTTSSTTYVKPDGTTAPATSIISGTAIMAEGTLSTDGKTMTAARITVLPTAADGVGGADGGPGVGGPGGPGHGDSAQSDALPETNTGTSTTTTSGTSSASI